jgi:hypothetical protein
METKYYFLCVERNVTSQAGEQKDFGNICIDEHLFFGIKKIVE